MSNNDLILKCLTFCRDHYGTFFPEDQQVQLEDLIDLMKNKNEEKINEEN